jgi:hypothetical protein
LAAYCWPYVPKVWPNKTLQQTAATGLALPGRDVAAVAAAAELGRSALEPAMQLEHVTFIGPPVDDDDLLGRLPADLAGLLRQINGFIQFQGGLHVRGACREPGWHSLRDAWDGADAFWRLYPQIRQTDVPFAEDCMGDQFFVRDGLILKLAAETGEIRCMELSLQLFFEALASDPVDFLSLYPLLQHQREGGTLEPGQLLSAYPPFCTRESAQGVSLAAVRSAERRRFLADMAAQLREVPDGYTIEFRVTE